MLNSELLPALNLFTLVAVVVVLAISLALFLRKRSNRHPMDTPRGKEIDAMHREEALEARTEQPR